MALEWKEGLKPCFAFLYEILWQPSDFFGLLSNREIMNQAVATEGGVFEPTVGI